MVDHVIEQFDLPEDVNGWREAMRRRAISANEVFGRHPWVPLLLDSRESSGPARLRYYDWVLGTPMRAGFTVDGASRAFSLLDSYIYGFGIANSDTKRNTPVLREWGDLGHNRLLTPAKK